jgi:hypothetical protein
VVVAELLDQNSDGEIDDSKWLEHVSCVGNSSEARELFHQISLVSPPFFARALWGVASQKSSET